MHEAEIITRNYKYKLSRVIHLVDSETVLCQVSAEATLFKVYEAGRISEIQKICRDIQDRTRGS